MAQAETQKVLNVDKEKFFQAVTRYEDYPKFVDGCKGVQVERKGPGKARAIFEMSMMKDFSYTIDLVEDAEAGTVRWTLVESDFFKINNGEWDIKALGPGKCEVRYALEVEFGISVPSFILNRLVKGSLPTMISGFEKRAKG